MCGWARAPSCVGELSFRYRFYSVYGPGQLVSDPSDNDTPAFSSLDDKLVLRPVRNRKETTSVTSWIEAFTVYMLVLTTYHPHRITDLLRYGLLIMRMAQMFPGLG